MKKSIYIICILCLVTILNGCNNEQNDEAVVEIKNTDTNIANNIEAVDEKENEILEKNSDLNSDDMVEKLGSDIVTEKDVKDEKDCDEGFVYHTELKECFEIGGAVDATETEVEIDPIVKECNDKGGIYNAQIEKCFID